ncbi:inositol 2-dehydrogenase 2-like isoform X2 [Ambystoma mexicanum]|uniref:inositol 2-dehydrogenase 2-like isoform X2 n=1 Tax=Ambystoma mexicanum TaxID=8296 RepID=UPI0037E9B853
MGRKKKTLHDYAAEFTDLAVKRHLIELKDTGETSVVETLYCKSCELPMRVRRDRILEHLASGRHYRNRRLIKQHTGRGPLVLSSCSDLNSSLPFQYDSSSLLPHSTYLVPSNPCSGNITASTSQNISPSPPSFYQQSMHPSHPNCIVSTTNTISSREDQTPSTSSTHPPAFGAHQVRNPPPPPKPTNQRLIISEASNSVASAVGRFSGSGACVNTVGLAIFGVGHGSKALLRCLAEEVGCHLLYIVDDHLPVVEDAFSSEFLANTRVLREQDMDIVLNDQRVTGVLVCSPPEAAADIVVDALRAGKGVLCEKLPSLDRQTAEACFDEADRSGKPLVCGFYKRFDPALQFLHKKVRGNRSLGRIHRIATVSHLFPAASVLSLKKSDLTSLKDADTVLINMKFPSGAIVSLDISQHCTKSCDQRLEIHGSQGSLRVDNQNSLGISEFGTSVPIFSQTQTDRYQEAYREMFRHFLRTLKGKELPVVTKEQFLWIMQVAAGAEQSWRNGTTVDLRNEAMDVAIIKTEIL